MIKNGGAGRWSPFGNLLLFLTMLLPAVAANQLIVGAETLFEEGTQISNPRILTSGAIALGLLGGYIVLFGGLLDLEETRNYPMDTRSYQYHRCPAGWRDS